jgi:ribonuclease HI
MHTDKENEPMVGYENVAGGEQGPDGEGDYKPADGKETGKKEPDLGHLESQNGAGIIRRYPFPEDVYLQAPKKATAVARRKDNKGVTSGNLVLWVDGSAPSKRNGPCTAAIAYIDPTTQEWQEYAIITVLATASSDEAELMAIAEALRIADSLGNDIESVTLFSDSKEMLKALRYLYTFNFLPDRRFVRQLLDQANILYDRGIRTEMIGSLKTLEYPPIIAQIDWPTSIGIWPRRYGQLASTHSVPMPDLSSSSIRSSNSRNPLCGKS